MPSPQPPRVGDSASRWAVKLDFVGARPVRPVGRQPDGPVVSYFKGRPDQWQTGLRTYLQLLYPDLWPGWTWSFRAR